MVPPSLLSSALVVRFRRPELRHPGTAAHMIPLDSTCQDPSYFRKLSRVSTSHVSSMLHC